MVKFLCILCFIIGIITKLVQDHLFNKLDITHNLKISNQSFMESLEDVEELAKNGNSEAKFAIVFHRINLISVCIGMGSIFFIFAF